jgi:hypothetical protein
LAVVGEGALFSPDEETEQRDRLAMMRKANVSSGATDMRVTAVLMVVTGAVPKGR